MMKYVYIILALITGVALGRLTAPGPIGKADLLPKSQETSASNMTTQPDSADRKENKSSDRHNSVDSKIAVSSGGENDSLARTDSKAKDKKIRQLSDLLESANEKNDIEEQNRLFAEMETLDPKHEKVFKAKAMFLQDDNNWDGAHDVLEECIATIPDSIFCLRRLTNIRSSTQEDVLNYGPRCLQISKNDPLCLVDYAIALRANGELEKSKMYFEQALNLPRGGEGYHREYILFHYAVTLDNLQMHKKAKEAYTESCRLNMKSACEKLRGS